MAWDAVLAGALGGVAEGQSQQIQQEEQTLNNMAMKMFEAKLARANDIWKADTEQRRREEDFPKELDRMRKEQEVELEGEEATMRMKQKFKTPKEPKYHYQKLDVPLRDADGNVKIDDDGQPYTTQVTQIFSGSKLLGTHAGSPQSNVPQSKISTESNKITDPRSAIEKALGSRSKPASKQATPEVTQKKLAQEKPKQRNKPMSGNVMAEQYQPMGSVKKEKTKPKKGSYYEKWLKETM